VTAGRGGPPSAQQASVQPGPHPQLASATAPGTAQQESTHEADANPLVDVGRLCAFLDQLQAELRLSPPA
jgi:hypothetical protein